jgi:uncharacterized protein YcfJ
MGAVDSPGGDREVGLFSQSREPEVVTRADRVGGMAQGARLGRAIGEQIGHHY